MDLVAKTAQWTAAARAHESERSDRLFNDPWARALAGTEGLRLEEKFSSISGGNPYLPIRTRVYDDLLTREIESGVEQVVILGAGLDTRSLRLDWAQNITVYEIDKADVLDTKDEILREAGAKTTCSRRLVAADLSTGWAGHLESSGYQADRDSIWVAEGLLFYLPAESARQLLSQAAQLAAPGSRLLADFIDQTALHDPQMRPYHQALKAEGAPWVYAEDHPESMLTECGWALEVEKRPGDADADFGRWPYPRVEHGAPGSPWSYIVSALRVP